jgi:hypothetical protein
MKPQDVRLGYLQVTSPVANAYIGGLMIVDGRGLPIEFRYTEPIQPTKIQQILYGTALSRYIKTEVILETLLKSLETRPHVLVVNDDCFLVKETNRDFEVVRLMETKSAPLKATGALEKISADEFLLQLTSESSPVRVQLGTDLPETRDLGTKSLPDKSKDAALEFKSSNTYTLLLETGRITDILEPLKRVEKALAVLCQEAGIKAAAT